MRYLALAADYDGTLATDGRVDEATVAGLEHLLASGRKLILVTGRELDELLAIFPQITLFERVVAENGALMYHPAAREEKLLAPRPSEEFVKELQARGVGPISVGRSIVATWEPHETTVLQVIRDLGLEMRVIFNKGAVMILPAGVTKATGLMAALKELGLSPHNVVGVGDAENDHALLQLCEYAVAVQNAIPMLKEAADWVTPSDHGAGVVELIHEIVADDLRRVESRLTRHHVVLGTREDGEEEVRISPYGMNLLLAGTSGSGKSTVATGLLERLAERAYQFCIIDPEGDYESFERAVVLGNNQRAPSAEEVLQLLEKPESNAVINLVGLPLQDRPAFFLGLLPRLQELRAKTGRPHWIVVDETHHLLPSGWDPASLTVSYQLTGMVFITVHPEQVSTAVLHAVDMVIALGEAPEQTVQVFATAVGEAVPPFPSPTLEPGEALVWSRHEKALPFTLRIAPSKMDRRRHRRKYAEGQLPPDRSFYFRGPSGALKLRAQNLVLFMQIADGIDDATWTYHLKRGDYSRWFREGIKDDALAKEASRVEQTADLSAANSRARIREAIERRYTLPAD
ncbi:MAG TPA: HAD-IIB family hydrolase, partial [Nitrospiraceae bacterium]|nr:HAD-IIB family hydrolase [Nitrospiraceae bacterium]